MWKVAINRHINHVIYNMESTVFFTLKIGVLTIKGKKQTILAYLDPLDNPHIRQSLYDYIEIMGHG